MFFRGLTERRYRTQIESLIDPHGNMRRSIHLIKNVNQRYGLNAGGPNSSWSSKSGFVGVQGDQYLPGSECRDVSYGRLAEVSTPYINRFWLWATLRLPCKIRCLKCRKRIGVLGHGEHYFCRCGVNYQVYGSGLTFWEGPSVNYPSEDDAISTFLERHPELQRSSQSTRLAVNPECAMRAI